MFKFLKKLFSRTNSDWVPVGDLDVPSTNKSFNYNEPVEVVGMDGIWYYKDTVDERTIKISRYKHNLSQMIYVEISKVL